MNPKINILLAAAAALSLAACGSTANPGTTEDRNLLRSRATAAVDDFKKTDPSLSAVLSSSYAYAVFPRITTAAVVVGGAHGDGEVYMKGKFTGWADVSQGSVGLQLGGQRYAELIIFRTETTYINFTNSTLEFDARASAIAAASGAASTADYSKGVVVFSLPEGGLMFQAAIGGQKFRFTPATP
jgi:lipid-binding SYLF domain-containing protein